MSIIETKKTDTKENLIDETDKQNKKNKQDRKNTKSKLAALKQKQQQLNAQIQLLEAAEKTRERKKDTRRKILIGAYYLDKARNENTFSALAKQMDSYLNRNADRELFELEQLPEKNKKITKEESQS